MRSRKTVARSATLGRYEVLRSGQARRASFVLFGQGWKM